MDIGLNSSVVEHLLSDAEGLGFDSWSAIFHICLCSFIPPIPTSFGAMAFLDRALILFDKSRQVEFEIVFVVCVLIRSKDFFKRGGGGGEMVVPAKWTKGPRI